MTIARVFGIRLRVNILFFFLLVLYGIAAACRSGSDLLLSSCTSARSCGTGHGFTDGRAATIWWSRQAQGLIEVNPAV